MGGAEGPNSTLKGGQGICKAAQISISDSHRLSGAKGVGFFGHALFPYKDKGCGLSCFYVSNR